MNVLIIDTATPVETVIVQAGGRFRETIKPYERSHSVSLFTSIDSCLGELGLTIRDIDLIGVGIGPGSFTGIRIAVSTARMLAQVLGKPLVGVTTTMIFAVSVSCAVGDYILIAFDAKKKRVFGALYLKKDGFLPAEIVPPGDYAIEYLLENVGPNCRIFAAGDGVSKYYRSISGKKDSVVFIEDLRPRGDLISRHVIDIYNAGPHKFTDYNAVKPLYSRKSDAEIALSEKTRNGCDSTS